MPTLRSDALIAAATLAVVLGCCGVLTPGHAARLPDAVLGERESEIHGLTHRVASDRPFFLLSYVAATGSTWRVDPGEPSENLPCRVNDLRLAVGTGHDLGAVGIVGQASLRVGLASTPSPGAGPLAADCVAMRGTLFWDLAHPASGHLRLQAVHRRLRWLSSEPGGGAIPTPTEEHPSRWSGSTMLEIGWGRMLGPQGIMCTRVTWDLGGSHWSVGCPVAGFLDYRRYVNRRTYLQLGAVLGVDPGSPRHALNPGCAIAIGNASGGHIEMDVDEWVRTLGWEVRVAYQPREDEPHSGTLLDQGSLLTLAVRLLR